MKLRTLALTSVMLLTAATLGSSILGQAAQAGGPKPGSQGTDKKVSFPSPRHGVPAGKLCKAPYFATASNALCMTADQPAQTYANAEALCRATNGRVADYGDWRTRILAGGASPTLGAWLGPITADNTALFVNSTSPGDFDGETSRFESRVYACARDIKVQ